MLIYGGFEVINTQFPPLSLEQLTQPLGAMSPMGLLGSFKDAKAAKDWVAHGFPRSFP